MIPVRKAGHTRAPVVDPDRISQTRRNLLVMAQRRIETRDSSIVPDSPLRRDYVPANVADTKRTRR